MASTWKVPAHIVIHFSAYIIIISNTTIINIILLNSVNVLLLDAAYHKIELSLAISFIISTKYFPTMVVFCLWWQWWESISDKIPPSKMIENIDDEKLVKNLPYNQTCKKREIAEIYLRNFFWIFCKILGWEREINTAPKPLPEVAPS